MAILTLGVSFRRAPLDVLERLAFSDDDLVKAYRMAADADGVGEAVILSTCNRVEITAEVPAYHAGFLALKELLCDSRGVEPDELADPLYSHWEQDAVEHIFAVAAGLDSMLLGETQIATQVREALRRAEAEGLAGPVLARLFHAASRAGRRARQETGLGAAPDAFVALASDLAGSELGGLEGRAAVVVGAGQMAALAVAHLRGLGAGPIRILNRSVERAQVLAERTGAEHGSMTSLPDAVERADLVVSATGAVGRVLEASTVAAAMRGRPERPLVLVDLAVPRDVDPETAEVPGVRLIDLDSVRDRLGEHDQAAALEIRRAGAIVAEEVRRYVVRRRGDDFAPLIRALRAHGDDVVRFEMQRHSARLADLTPEQRAGVEALANGIVAKLLHDPIVELKERSEPGSEGVHARVLAELLGLDPDS